MPPLIRDAGGERSLLHDITPLAIHKGGKEIHLTRYTNGKTSVNHLVD
jgi:hypothetical protein